MAGYYKASFTAFDKILFAFYTEDAEFMGIAVNMPVDQLPASLKTKLKKDYGSYWITDLFKAEINNKTGYYITLENKDYKLMLKAEGTQGWSFYKSMQKD